MCGCSPCAWMMSCFSLVGFLLNVTCSLQAVLTCTARLQFESGGWCQLHSSLDSGSAGHDLFFIGVDVGPKAGSILLCAI